MSLQQWRFRVGPGRERCPGGLKSLCVAGRAGNRGELSPTASGKGPVLLASPHLWERPAPSVASPAATFTVLPTPALQSAAVASAEPKPPCSCPPEYPLRPSSLQYYISSISPPSPSLSSLETASHVGVN